MAVAIMSQGNVLAEGSLSEPPLRQRLATILVADVAGYSRLMGCDERGTVAALDHARAVFRAIDRSASTAASIDMAGDSVLAVFDAATGAVNCALAVQRRLAAARAESPPRTAGCAFASACISATSWRRATARVYGDGVNIAARLEGARRAGRRGDFRAVLWAVKKRVDARFEDFGEQRVKNIAEPVRAFRVLDRRDRRRRPATAPRRPPRTSRGGAPGAGARPCRQAVDRRAAVQQHERRPGAGVLRRRHHRGHHHRAVALPRAVRDLAQLVVQVQGPSRSRCRSSPPSSACSTSSRAACARSGSGCASRCS